MTTKAISPKKMIGVNLRTPYISDVTYVEGEVLESHDKVKNILYETRMRFVNLTPEAEFVIGKLMDYFLNGEKEGNE